MGPDQYRAADHGYHNHHSFGQPKVPPTPGPSPYQGHYSPSPFRHNFNYASYPQTPPSAQSRARGGPPPYYAMNTAPWMQHQHPHPNPHQTPADHGGPAWSTSSYQPRTSHQEPQQPTLNWVQSQAPKTDQQQGNGQSNEQTSGQAQPNTVSQPTTIDPYSGYYWDTTGWRPAIVGVSKQSMAGNATNGNNDNGQTKVDEWGTSDNNNTSNNNNDDGWGNNNTSSNDATNNNDSAWDTPVNNDSSSGDNNNAWDNSNNNDTGGGANEDWNKGSGDNGNNNDWTQNSNDNSNSGGGGGWEGDTNNNGSNDNNNSNVNSGPAPATLHGPHGAYAGPRIAVEPNRDTPWIADEPPRYDVPTSVINTKNLSNKQVQRGRAYNYYKRHRKPIYIDSIEEPYARFVFKYRTKDKLPKGLNVEAGYEPTPDEGKQDLQDKKKEDLIEELLRFRAAYGEAAPAPPPKLAENENGDNDATPWEAEPPSTNSFLQYKLPPHYGDTVPEGGNSGGAGATSNGGDSWGGGGGGGGDSKPTNNNNSWETNNSNGGGGNSWDTGGGDSGGGKSGW